MTLKGLDRVSLLHMEREFVPGWDGVSCKEFVVCLIWGPDVFQFLVMGASGVFGWQVEGQSHLMECSHGCAWSWTSTWVLLPLCGLPGGGGVQHLRYAGSLHRVARLWMRSWVSTSFWRCGSQAAMQYSSRDRVRVMKALCLGRFWLPLRFLFKMPRRDPRVCFLGGGVNMSLPA